MLGFFSHNPLIFIYITIICLMQEFYIEMVKRMFNKILFVVGLLNCDYCFSMQEDAGESRKTSGAICADERRISEEDKRFIAGLLANTNAQFAALKDFSDLERAYLNFTDDEAKWFIDVYEKISNSPCSLRPSAELIVDNLSTVQEDAAVQRMIQEALKRSKR